MNVHLLLMVVTSLGVAALWYRAKTRPRLRQALAVVLLGAAVSLGLLLTLMGSRYVPIRVQVPDGVSQSQLDSAIQHTFGTAGLKSALVGCGYDDRLTTDQLKGMIYIHEADAEFRGFDARIACYNTWKWKAEAVEVIAKELGESLQRRLDRERRGSGGDTRE